MQHIVSLSGGTASAVAADRVLTRYGPENTTLWFADTSWEDEDLYRFLEDLEAYWKVTIVRYKDGRTPLEVGRAVPKVHRTTTQANHGSPGHGFYGATQDDFTQGKVRGD